MKIKRTKQMLWCLLAGCISYTAETYAQKIGDDFIVIEAENTTSDLDMWQIVTPDDSRYFRTPDGIMPINGTHLEFTGNNYNSGPATSPLEYTFICPKTATYRMAMRMWQRLEGLPEDKCNDVYIRMAGNFTSGNYAYTTEDLQSDMKFYGRGVDTWGTCYKGDKHERKDAVLYNLIEGEEYTFTMSGRAQRTNIDYILFFDTDLGLHAQSFDDLAAFNDPIYRPEHSICEGINAVDMHYINMDGFTDAELDNKAGQDILSVAERGAWAAARTIFDGHSGIATSFTLNAMQETDGESTYRIRINGELIGEVTNDRIFDTEIPDYAIQSHLILDTLPLNNGDTIQVEFNNTTNGLVPEDDTTATSRGRWVSLEICTSGQFPIYYLNMENRRVEIEESDTTTLELSYKINPLDEALQWISRNESVVTVSQDGFITALDEGTTYVVANHDKRMLMDSCRVTVTAFAPEVALETNSQDLCRSFPNPFSTGFTVQHPKGIQEVRLTDLTGKTVYQRASEGERELLCHPGYNSVPAGTYVLNISDGDDKYSSLITRVE